MCLTDCALFACVCVQSHPHTAPQVEVSQLDAESQDRQNSRLLRTQQQEVSQRQTVVF